MRKFIANFVRIPDIYKDFAGNRVNAPGNHDLHYLKVAMCFLSLPV